MWTFNVGNGFSEAILRGYKLGLLTNSQYSNLTQCTTLEEMKNQLLATDYQHILQENDGKLNMGILAKKLRNQYVREFKYLRSIASVELGKFLDYITYGYMIDNVVILLAGALRSFEGDTTIEGGEEELLERCHPLGMFETMPALLAATSVDEIYNTVLIESPLAPYFLGCFSADDLDELHLELIRNHLWKAYLEDFYAFLSSDEVGPGVNADTRRSMQELLEFEADRRILNIAINSLGNDRLSKIERFRLFPRIGKIFEPASGLIAERLAFADDFDQIRVLLDPFPFYRNFLQAITGTSTKIASEKYGNFQSQKSLEELCFEHEIYLCKEAFSEQFTFTVFYAWTRLKEQEIRNVIWIGECIGQGQKQNIHNYLPIW